MEEQESAVSGVGVSAAVGLVTDEAGVDKELGALLPELWYSGSHGRERVPSWASEFVRLGAEAAASYRGGERLVAAVAVPTRAFAATLSGVGAVAARTPAPLDDEQPSAEAIEAHFSLLTSLRPGTTVTVRSGNSKNVGTIERVDTSGAEPVIVIRQKNFLQMYKKFGCQNISVHGRSLSCLFVGRINVFEEEMVGRDVVTRDSQPLQSILKVGRFAGRRDHEVRSDILPAAGDVPPRLREAQPDLVIFDGTASFRHWRENWRRVPWLVVLDRTSQHFDEGVQLVEEEFAERASAQLEQPNLVPPPGTELMAFWSSR
jgi:hypothetical protein